MQLKVMRKTSKNITRWFFPSQTPPIRLNHHVPTVLLSHTNMQFFRSHCLIFNHPPTPLYIWQPIFPNKVIQVITCLYIRTFLSYVWYNLYCLLPWHPKVRRVSCNNYIFNIIYLIMRYQILLSWGVRNFQMWSVCCQSFANNWSLSSEERDPRHTLD